MCPTLHKVCRIMRIMKGLWCWDTSWGYINVPKNVIQLMKYIKIQFISLSHSSYLIICLLVHTFNNSSIHLRKHFTLHNTCPIIACIYNSRAVTVCIQRDFLLCVRLIFMCFSLWLCGKKVHSLHNTILLFMKYYLYLWTAFYSN